MHNDIFVVNYKVMHVCYFNSLSPPSLWKQLSLLTFLVCCLFTGYIEVTSSGTEIWLSDSHAVLKWKNFPEMEFFNWKNPLSLQPVTTRLKLSHNVSMSASRRQEVRKFYLGESKVTYQLKKFSHYQWRWNLCILSRVNGETWWCKEMDYGDEGR